MSFKRIRIVMLSTKEKADKTKGMITNNGRLFTDGVKIGMFQHNNYDLFYQHLYLTFLQFRRH